MTTRLEELKKGLVCLVPKDGKAGITCHEKTICDCTALRMIELLERAAGYIQNAELKECVNCPENSPTPIEECMQCQTARTAYKWLKDLEEL